MNRRTLTVAAILLTVLLGFGAGGLWTAMQLRPGGTAVERRDRPLPNDAPERRDTSAGESRLSQFLVLGLVAAGLIYLWQRQRAVYAAMRPKDRPGVAARMRSALAQLDALTPEGAPDLEIRMLGIEALADIGRHVGDDRAEAVRLLAGYLRRNARQVYPRPEISGLGWRVDLQASLKAATELSAPQGIKPPAPLDLSLLDLRQVAVSRLDLRGVRLTGTWLNGADFASARLDGVDLTDAVLHGADMRFALGLTQAQLACARFDDTTQLPESLAGAEL